MLKYEKVLLLHDGKLLAAVPRLHTLALEALEALRTVFGLGDTMAARVDPLPDAAFRVVLLLPHAYAGDAAVSLRQFYTDYWLAHGHASDGPLVFDYEVHHDI